MTALYLFCLIVGGGLLLASLFGGDAEADVDTGNLELDGPADMPDAGGADAGAEGGGHAAATHGVGWTLARDFFTVRSLFYFLAGFGATGFLLESLTAATDLTALTMAVLTGVVAAGIAGATYGTLQRSESGKVSRNADYLVGHSAEVILPVVAGRRGKIRILNHGREVELLARLYSGDDPDCARGSTVVIVDIDGDTALVTAAPSLSSDLS